MDWLVDVVDTTLMLDDGKSSDSPRMVEQKSGRRGRRILYDLEGGLNSMPSVNFGLHGVEPGSGNIHATRIQNRDFLFLRFSCHVVGSLTDFAWGRIQEFLLCPIDHSSMYHDMRSFEG